MYQTELEGVHYELGTSGFLYRSNKLMYDAATKSLWSTLQGEPVVGPLAGKGIRLERRYVVTTDWQTWKQRHPQTSVLSLDTGHRRNYGEGVAYREYFATDVLMFEVPKTDDRLRNKDEVVALRTADEQLAVSAEFLQRHPAYHDHLGDTNFVILTDTSGANRVYAVGDILFTTWDSRESAVDTQNRVWRVTPAALKLAGQTLPRMPSHRVFWFGWFAQYPGSRLVR